MLLTLLKELNILIESTCDRRYPHQCILNHIHLQTCVCLHFLGLSFLTIQVCSQTIHINTLQIVSNAETKTYTKIWKNVVVVYWPYYMEALQSIPWCTCEETEKGIEWKPFFCSMILQAFWALYLMQTYTS